MIKGNCDQVTSIAEFQLNGTGIHATLLDIPKWKFMLFHIGFDADEKVFVIALLNIAFIHHFRQKPKYHRQR